MDFVNTGKAGAAAPAAESEEAAKQSKQDKDADFGSSVARESDKVPPKTNA